VKAAGAAIPAALQQAEANIFKIAGVEKDTPRIREHGIYLLETNKLRKLQCSYDVHMVATALGVNDLPPWGAGYEICRLC